MVAKTISNRPEIVVRKRIERIVKVEELAKQGSIPYAFIKYVESLINKRGSMIIAGPPGSGKTTLLRAILHSMIPGSWKIAIIEDTPEIDPLPGSSWSRYTSFELGRVKVDLFDLAKASLRSSATRLLVVGETRGAEAQVLTQAINTGMGALTTFHAGSPEEAIARLRSQPIGLSNSQVSMFWAIAIMGFQSATPRRILRSVAELIPRGDDPPEINVIYDRMRDGVEIEYDKLVMRSRRLSTLGDGDGSAKMV
jgi:flagellar protein FlaI